MEPTDEALVEQARRGDADAFRALVERHYRKVYAITMGMVRNPDDAMELTQEAFLHLHRSIHGFRFQAKFSTWLYRIVTNLCVDHFRRAGRAPLPMEPPAGSEEEEAPMQWADPGAEAPDQAAYRSELRGALEGAFAHLSAPHRAVMVLREVEGLSYEEIAEVMGSSIGTVMSRLHYARKRLQALLAPYRPAD
ncbi:MAG: sigma-70 family RNA polymerase sigma factor [Nitrospirota bacterium]